MNQKINLNITDFKQFREGGYHYVDKSRFIEHLAETGNTLHLICRPRRVGKSMNLTMLKYFFDLKEDSISLFGGLYIENCPAYKNMNQHPVIYLNFKDLRMEDYQTTFASTIEQELKRYLKADQISKEVLNGISPPYPLIRTLLRNATKNLYDVLGIKPYVLIDEYDKPIMDNVYELEFEKIRKFIKAALSSALKDNPYLEGAVLTGVNRIAQESLFSDLNNLTIIDVFRKSLFDTDFGFTEEEVRLLHDKVSITKALSFDMDDLRAWYNNYRIGNSVIYFGFSVLSALQVGELDNYWGKSGVMDVIRSHLTPERVEQVIEITNGFPEGGREVGIKDRLTIDDMREYGNDNAFYSLLIQTGYMTYEALTPAFKFFKLPQMVELSSLELKNVWEDFILDSIYRGKIQNFGSVLRRIKDPQTLGRVLTETLNNRLSYCDFEEREPEKTYHVFVAGMLTAFDYKWVSNRESGYGRYDIAVELPEYNLIFEFKKEERPEDMEKGAKGAIRQAKGKLYEYGLDQRKKSILVGVGFSGKMCVASASMSDEVASCDE